MKYVVDRTVHVHESDSITILLNEDVKFRLRLNSENKIVINKSNLGDFSHSISITPNVSNEITIS